MSTHKVDIIIATTAERKRKESLLRAIESILSQQGVKALPIIVINGTNYDDELRNALERRTDILVTYEKVGSAPNAHKVGRSHSKSDYFCFLDDDDLLLEGTLAERVLYLENNAQFSLLVCNGYRFIEGESKIMFEDLKDFSLDPLGSLLRKNWMASCAALFRASDITIDYFENYADYMEWTVLGFRIAQHFKVGFLDIPVYQINVTPQSLSQSKKYLLGCVTAIGRMVTDCESKYIKSLLKKKYAKALHESAGYLLNNNELVEGLKYHIKSLKTGYGWRYILFTRKFIYRFLRRTPK